MKKLVKVEEVSGEGLLGLLGETVTIYCLNYIYAGVLEGVNDKCIKLKNAHIVFETGAFTADKFSDAQKIGDEYYVAIPTIESFGVTNKVL